MTLASGQSYQTGDINLAAAVMSCGVPLNPSDPVSQIEHPNGDRYGRFSLAGYSMDGKTNTEDLMLHWSGHKKLPDSHGFSQVCRFIKDRPKGVQKTSDLLDFAVEYLQKAGFLLTGLRGIDSVAGYVNNHENEASYVLAYVSNRDLCFNLYRSMTRKVYYEAGTGDDIRRALLDTRLPKREAKELLSRLQG